MVIRNGVGVGNLINRIESKGRCGGLNWYGRRGESN